MPLTVLTVGHSNRSLDAFLAILKAHGVECLADVRTIPRSRHNPQFNAEALEKSLPMAGIVYTRLPRLGGLRKPRKDSRNLAWRNDTFRGYADYMETAEFERPVAAVVERLGAHDGGAPVAGQDQELGNPFLELGGLHVVGVAAEGVVAPGQVARVLARLAQSSQAGKAGIGDAGSEEGFLQGFGAELGIVA